jgi:peptidyl-tRNA hydrolase, PTH2 family
MWIVLETQTSVMSSSDLKMYLLVRTDLGMKPGKVAAQAAHAAVGAYKTALVHKASALKTWEQQGAAKIALRVASESALWAIHDAVSSRTTTYYVVDQGRTKVAPDSVTVLAVGPVDSALVADVLGGLKLY